MRSKDAVVNYILKHVISYKQHKRLVQLEGTCYATWDSYIFSLNQPEIIATMHDQMISQAPIHIQKCSDPESSCDSPEKKKSKTFHCSQDASVAKKIQEN